MFFSFIFLYIFSLFIVYLAFFLAFREDIIYKKPRRRICIAVDDEQRDSFY